MNRPEPMSPFMLDPEHVPLTWCEFLDRKGVSAEQYSAMTDAAKWKISREFDGRPDTDFMPVLDMNALDPDERSVDEKLQQLNEDQTWDSRSEGNWE